MKLKKGDKLIFVGFERTDPNGRHLSKMVFETSAGNKIIIEADGEPHYEHYLTLHIPSNKKLEEELDV